MTKDVNQFKVEALAIVNVTITVDASGTYSVGFCCDDVRLNGASIEAAIRKRKEGIQNARSAVVQRPTQTSG